MRHITLRVSCAARVVGVALLLGCAWLQPAAGQHRDRDDKDDKDDCRERSHRKLTFVVDGLSGAVIAARGKCTLFPGDSVAVTIQRANVMHYAYEVSFDSARVLAQTYGIVGIGQVTEAGPADSVIPMTYDSKLFTDALRTLDSSLTNKGKRELIEKIKTLIDRFRKLDTLHRGVAGTVSKAVRPVFELDRNLNAIDSFPTRSRDPRFEWSTEYASVDSAFHAQPLALLGTVLAGLRQRLAVLRDDLAEFRLRIALFNGGLPRPSPDSLDLGEFPKLFDSLVVVLVSAVEATSKRLDTAAERVKHWRVVRAARPEPKIELVFPVVRANLRQYLSVTRRPISEAAIADARAADAGVPATTPPTKVTLARVSYDAHSHSAFNLSVGFVAGFRPQVRTFGTVASLRSDGLLEYRIARTSVDRFSVQPAVQLGIYLPHAIDALDSKGPKWNWMATIGAQIAGGDRDYYGGVAWDWRGGIQLGLGVTAYKATALADGWAEGQIIPVDGTGAAVVQTPPTKTQRAVGFYAYLGFRPVIFETLAKAVGIGK